MFTVHDGHEAGFGEERQVPPSESPPTLFVSASSMCGFPEPNQAPARLRELKFFLSSLFFRLLYFLPPFSNMKLT
jgi:hypothetical protein